MANRSFDLAGAELLYVSLLIRRRGRTIGEIAIDNQPDESKSCDLSFDHDLQATQSSIL